MKNTRLPQIRQRLGYSSELSMAKEGTWACNSCIAAGRAIVPSYKNHYYGYGVNFYPPVMYVNKTLSCQRCQKSFDFTAEEQWHYYEELRLEFSTPRYCLPCRALARKERQLHQTIGGVLSRYAPHSLEANRTLAELYTMVGNARKAGIYRARARALES